MNTQTGGNTKTFVSAIPSDTIAIAAGLSSLALREIGDVQSVWALGQNGKGQIAGGPEKLLRHFTPVQTIIGAMAIEQGGYHSLILTHQGRVWATGWNKYGQLGDGTQDDDNKFFKVIYEGGVAIAAGDIHSVVLKADGSVWAAGRNYNGQLGDGSRKDRDSFLEVMYTGAVRIAAGAYHSLVLKMDGSVWTTGWNMCQTRVI